MEKIREHNANQPPTPLTRFWKAITQIGRTQFPPAGEDMARSDTARPGLPADIAVLFRRALEYHKIAEIEQARLLYQEIIAHAPGHFDARYLLGMIALQQQQFGLALEHLNVAKASNPESTDVHCALGNALGALGRDDDALASYDHALAIDPDSVEVLTHRAWPLHRLGRNAEALANLEAALQRKPDDVEALTRRGNVLIALGRPDAALSSFDRALQLEARNPEALNNRGTVLNALGRLHDAMESFDQALQINPHYPDAHNNRGLVLSDLHRYDDAIRSYGNALAINPADPNAQYNQSLIRLLRGEFASGWLQYEWRWKIEQFRNFTRPFSRPQWKGSESLSGKTILLHAEQGLGDTIQFCRYASLVARRGAHVILEVPPSLIALMSGLDGVQQLIAAGGQPAQLDFHCPLLSLPLAFNTGLDTIPAFVPYLHADSTRTSCWKSRMGERGRLTVGMAWSGNPGHKNDHNRSIPLTLLAPLLATDALFVSLQKEIRDSDRAALEHHESIRHFGAALEDFSETAALMECMDLIITVDTAVAHLAGAMGKPVWILLPYNPDWRWLLERDDCPWYPTARLFRQPAIGDWKTVIGEVTRALTAFSQEIASR